MKKSYTDNGNCIKLLGIPIRINLINISTIARKEIELGISKRVIIKKYNVIMLKDALAKKSRYEFVAKNGKFLLFYGTTNYRFDHRRTFSSFSERFEDADVLSGYKEKRTLFHPLWFLYSYLHALVWLIQLLLSGYSLLDSSLFIPHIYTCFITNKSLRQTDLKKYKFVVVYYDVNTDDNYVVQACEASNIVTMTLQHGIFAKKESVDSISDFGLEFTESIADYYLCWNQYTKDEAIKAGMNPERIVVLGIPKYINITNNNTINNYVRNTFGVILNSKSFHIHNQELIKIANEISSSLNVKYIVRYHPQLKGNEYSYLYGPNYLENDDNKTTIEDYAQKVDFTIISSSSVFVDLIYLKHPTYRLVVTNRDTYSTVSYNSFKNCEEFLDIYRKTSPTDDTVFNYLCTTTSVYDNYRDFFNKFL